VKLGVGEVDLVVRRGRTVAFVEVKWRAQAAALDWAVDARRLTRVARAAEALAPRFARFGEDVRIDVILLTPWRWPRRIVHVWQPGADPVGLRVGGSVWGSPESGHAGLPSSGNPARSL
jgi:putative endonuclease